MRRPLLKRALELTVALLLTAVQLGAGAPARTSKDGQYASVCDETMRAVDSGKTYARLASAWRRYEAGKTPRNGVAAGLATYFAAFVWSHQLAGAPPGGLDIEGARRALHGAMAREGESAYPTLIYAWYVNTFGEPGLAPPIMKDLGSVEITVGGRKEQMQRHRIVADPAKDKRVKELLAKAGALDPSNPLLLYLRGLQAADPSEKCRLLWKSIGPPGTSLWEFSALRFLRGLAKGKPEEEQRVIDWAARAKTVVGDSPRAKGNGF